MASVMRLALSSSPATVRGMTPSLETSGVSETPADTRDSSSMSTPNASEPPPEPPCSSG